MTAEMMSQIMQATSAVTDVLASGFGGHPTNRCARQGEGSGGGKTVRNLPGVHRG